MSNIIIFDIFQLFKTQLCQLMFNISYYFMVNPIYDRSNKTYCFSQLLACQGLKLYNDFAIGQRVSKRKICINKHNELNKFDFLYFAIDEKCS